MSENAPGRSATEERSSKEITARIHTAIRDHGPITFAEFMEHALYGPGGFYERPPVGRGGHFVTSPHVHPVFGELVAIGLRQMWTVLGRPEPFRLTEVGAGDGTLAEQILERLADVPLEYLAVERSPGGRAHLTELPVRVAAELGERIEGGVVLANELLDNLPFRRVRGAMRGTVEVRVGHEAGAFVEIETACDGELAALCPPLGRGEEAAVPIGGLAFVDTLADRLAHGYALLIDYGEAGGPAGEVHGYRSHRVVEDVFADPGSADITAGVDFAVIIARARDRGLATHGPVTQRAALHALGFERWGTQQRKRQAAMLAAGSGMDAVRAWGGRSRASLLVDPTALGRLRWLVLSTPGLDPPPWLLEAERSP